MCILYTIYHKKNESSKRPENIFPAEVLGMECYKGSKKLGPFLVFVEFLESFSTSMPKRTTHLNSINYKKKNANQKVTRYPQTNKNINTQNLWVTTPLNNLGAIFVVYYTYICHIN